MERIAALYAGDCLICASTVLYVPYDCHTCILTVVCVSYDCLRCALTVLYVPYNCLIPADRAVERQERGAHGEDRGSVGGRLSCMCTVTGL